MKDSQAQEDIWHLTLDDLWAAPPAENPRLGGDGPFVINLSTSPAPIAVPPKDELYIENISVYVISRNEDGRQRFRLRLGPISTELEADAILSAVRERYPGALTATASEEDLRAIGHATRNTKGAKPAGAPPAAAKQSIERNAPKSVGKPVETKVAVRPTEPKVEAKVAPRPAEPKADVKVAPRPAERKADVKIATRPPAPKADAKPAAKADDAPIVMLPPAPVIDRRDDSDEPTGTGWEIDSLLPHLAGPAPQSKTKAPAAKSAQVARKVAPPAKGKTLAAVKPAPQEPAAQIPLAVVPPAPAAPAKAEAPPAPKPPVLTAAVESPKHAAVPAALPVAKTVATPIVELVAPAATITAVVPPPVAEAAAPPIVEVATTPIVEVPPPPVAEAVAVSAIEPAPPLIAKLAPPPAPEPAPRPVDVAEATPAPDAKPSPTATFTKSPEPVATKAAPAATTLPPLTVRNPRIEIRKSPTVRPESSRPAIAEKPVAVTPTATKKERVPTPAILAADAPPADPFETDWAAILSARVEDTLSRKALHAHAPVSPEPARVIAVKASDDSGLQRLVERSNALVQQMDEQVDAVATEPPIVAAMLVSPPEPLQPAVASIVAAEPVVTAPAQVAMTATLDLPPVAPEPAPLGVIFSPLNTQSIEQKLAKLAEILHGGDEAEATAPVAPPLAPTPAPAVEAAAPSEPDPVPSFTETDFDVEISFDDDVFATPATAPATTPWFEVDRRNEPRRTLKSPDEVLSSIDQMVVVDEANNLTDVMARQKEPVIDATAETDRRPVLVLTEEPKPQDASPEPQKLEIAVVEAPIAEPTPVVAAPAIVVAPELTLAPEFALAPTESVPSQAAESVIVLRLPELEFTIDEPAPAVAAPPSPAVGAVSVVSTVVLDDPAPKPRAEESRVPTVVLEPTPAATSPGETAADHAAKDARHLSARAAARAAKKIRLAKDAAKKAAAAAARSTGAEPAKADAEPTLTTHPPAQPAVAAEPPSPPQPIHAPTAAPAHAPVHVRAQAPAPAPSNKKQPQVPQKKPEARPPVPAAKPQPAAAKPQPSTPKYGHVPARPTASPPAAKKVPAAPMRPAASGERKVTIRSEHTASMDSTQTIRALTPLELADNQVSKWYVIQLAISEDDFDPDQIPQLDIFDAFRLYSVIGLDGPKILHALRLGFFSDEISAQAVHGYLKAHFESSAVKRVSIAERERFAESQVEARKDIGATGMHAIIEMASPTPVPETRLADLQNSANQRPAEEKSIWSRLVSPLKRQ